jgi:DNA-binding response OmpR family regulator
MKVLIVDDEPMNISILEEILEDEGFETYTAGNGNEALAVLQSTADIQIILLDKMMPDMDGMAFMDEFNKHPEWSSKRVIMQTAATSDEDVVEGSNTGVFYYLTKPFNSSIILSLIRAAKEDIKGTS